MNPAVSSASSPHIVSSQIAFLTSQSGRIYAGCDIPEREVELYIRELSKEEPADFNALRKNQSARDRGLFHLTVISPPEFARLSPSLALDFIGETVGIQLCGLGKATRGGQRSFFVVVQCERIAELRQDLRLGHRDLHITLGFDRNDVHDISKDGTTLI